MFQLRRVTSGGRFIPEVDGLRFAAISTVLLYHFHGPVAAHGAVPATHDSFRIFAEHGYRGVNLFYVISGFILGLPFAAHHLKGAPPVSLRSYFRRRLTRLEPPYVLNLLICFAVLVLLQGERPQTLLPHLAAGLFYLHNLWFGQGNPVNPVAWTLEVEVQFYCLAPLLASIFAARSKLLRRLGLASAILCAGLLQRFYWNGPERVKLTILFAIQFFLAGFLLADVYVADWQERPRSHWVWDVVAVLCWPLLLIPGDYDLWVWLPWLLLLVSMAAFRGVLFRGLFRSPIVVTIGGMCYSIYLFHYQLIPPVFRWTGPLHAGPSFNAYFALQALLYAIVVVLVCGLYFVLVERPCMQWRRRPMQ